MTHHPSAILARDVQKSFPEKDGRHALALKDVSLTIARGEFFVILGPSGCGKSTLLRIFSGLDTATHGHVEYGEGIAPQDIGFVFQHFALLPWMTVRENIELGLISRGVPAADRAKIVREELALFGLSRHADHHPRDLSGGLRQRVGLARAFAPKPKLLFMDEPFSELDSFTAEELRQELLRQWRERGATIVLVTHIIAEALELADRIAVMTGRPGAVEAIVENTLPRPRDKRSPAFFALEDKLASLVRPQA
jgi:NitT/TauT family transport system ATP-binding protein